MASSYTGLGTELMTTGENAGTWGSTTNTNLQIIEQLSGGYVEKAVTSTPTTLSVSDGSTGAELAHRIIKFTGTISEATTVTVPLDVQQMYILMNGTSGNYTVTFKYVTGSGDTVVFKGTDKGTKIVYATADHATNPNMVDTGIASHQIHNTLTVGIDDTGYDVKFFGATSGSYALWDESADSLLLTDSTPLKIGDSQDLTLYHDGSNSYITNAVGALKVATETSGIAVTIGHTTSEVTVADNLTVTGTLTLGSGAELTEAELEFLDGITAGTAAASKAMVLDSSADITGGRNLTISGELDAATGDFSGDVDVDGTLEADAITINSTAIGSIYGVVAGSSSIVTTGALDSGSITSGFGAIDNGTSNIRSATITAETAFVPDASGGADLGTTALEFNDLFLNDSGSIQFGDDQDTTLTHTDGTGLTLNCTNKLCFYDTALSISSSTDGQLDIDADTEVEIATTTLDLNGALDVSGASQFSGAITVGVDGTGLDVKFFGDTAGSFLLWDQSDDALELTDSSPIKIGDGGDMTIYHDGTDSFVTNSQGGLKLATETSGIAVTIGHTTSETTVADNLTITGTTVGTTFDVNGTADAIILDTDADTTISSPTDDQIDFEIAGADDFTMTANTFTILSGSTIAIAAGGAITNAGTMAPDIVSSGKAAVFGF